MNIITRLINRIFFKFKKVHKDESKNVVDGMVKANKLYKELIIKAHPDRNQDKRILAEKITEKLINNKHNYAELLKLKDEINKYLS